MSADKTPDRKTTGKIAFQGEAGANSHEACRTYFADYEPTPCATFEDAFEAVLVSEGSAHWLSVLRAAKVPAGPINEVDEAFALADELGMEPVEEVDGTPLIRPPLRVDGERPPIRHAPPALNQHSEELRAWLRSP